MKELSENSFIDELYSDTMKMVLADPVSSRELLENLSAELYSFQQYNLFNGEDKIKIDFYIQEIKNFINWTSPSSHKNNLLTQHTDEFRFKESDKYNNLNQGNSFYDEESCYDHNIDVPPDGSCLFWSVVCAYLFPVRDNESLFKSRFKHLFSDNYLSLLDQAREFFQGFDPFRPDYSLVKKRSVGMLVKKIFRDRVVNFMRQNRTVFEGACEGDFDGYLDSMCNQDNWEGNVWKGEQWGTDSWAGELEVGAISLLLNISIEVSYADKEKSHYDILGTETLIKLIHLGAHYNFRLEPESPVKTPFVNSLSYKN